MRGGIPILVLGPALVGMVALLLLPAAGAAPDRAAQSVSLTVVRTPAPGIPGVFRLRFAGAISSDSAGEDVTVLQQTCGYSFSTAVAGAQTRTGGAWEAEPTTPAVIALSATYRARWGTIFSEPVTIRPAISVFFVPVSRTHWLVRVTIGSAQQDMRRRIVVFQRLRGRVWKNIERKRLVIDRSGLGGGLAYVARFRVPRGWTVRALVPARTAAPCFQSGASEKLRS